MVVIRVCVKSPLSHLCDLTSRWFKAEFSVSSQSCELASGTTEFQNLLSLHPQGYPVLVL